MYCPTGFADHVGENGEVRDGEWRQDNEVFAGLQPVLATHARNFTLEASNVRNRFAAYFMSPEGSLEWQWEIPGLLGIQHG